MYVSLRYVMWKWKTQALSEFIELLQRLQILGNEQSKFAIKFIPWKINQVKIAINKTKFERT